ncbi:MAG: lipid-A-disaccharide synthase [Candidatus Omnitrophota bacterium]
MRHLKLFFSVGEESADLHASRLCAELKKRDAEIELFGFGGEKLQAEGVEILYPLPELALVGFVEVLKHLPAIFRLQSLARRAWEERKPDAVVLVDYPGFNLRLAKAAHERGIPVLYYIAPQAWAWKEGRTETMRRIVRRLMVIFPFEEPFFRKRGVETCYVGHPLLERIAPPNEKETHLNAPLIGLLPGSRKNELRHLLPVMLKAAALLRERLPQARFRLFLADGLPVNLLHSFSLPHFVDVVRDKNYERRRELDFAWTGSGTATVENALLGIPMAVLFRSHPINVFLGRRLVRIPYIGMVNLIAQKGVCPEFIQEQCQPETLARYAEELLSSPERYFEMIEDLKKMRARMGEASASKRAAEEIFAALSCEEQS